jgi:hypothetical protein
MCGFDEGVFWELSERVPEWEEELDRSLSRLCSDELLHLNDCIYVYQSVVFFSLNALIVQECARSLL